MKLFTKKKLSKEENIRVSRNTFIICIILTILLIFIWMPASLLLALASGIWFYRYIKAKKA